LRIDAIANIAVSALVSGLVSGVALKYITRYFDKKLEAEEQRRKKLEQQRHDRTVAEANRRRAAGRLFFWLHHAITKPPANGELEDAMKNYTAAEEAQKALEQDILASYEEDQK
jgi:mannitol-specific phosphotransferase system IIBC component